MHIIAALLLAFVIASIFFFMTWSRMVWLVVFVVVFFVLKKMLRKTGPSPTAFPAGFNAQYAHDNIAIDVDADKLWLRDRSGSRVVDKNDVLRWNRTYRPGNGGAEIENSLEVHLRDLERPKCVVRFNRHGDTWKSGAARNAQESAEWVSRLTTWRNDT